MNTEYGQRVLTVQITGSDAFGIYRQVTASGKVCWWWSRLDGDDVEVSFDERGPFDTSVAAFADASRVLK